LFGPRIASLLDTSDAENTGIARFAIWRAALNILKDRPLTGIGQDQFIYQDAKYGVPRTRYTQTSHPHNWVFDFWLRLGLPGLLWITAALAWFFWQGIRLWGLHKGTALGALVLGLVASMVDYAVHGLLDMAYFTMDLALTFWMSMAMLLLVKMGAVRTDDD
jgi:O-antigen ligase